MYLVCSLILVVVCVAIVACLVRQVISFTSVLAVVTLAAAAGIIWLFVFGKNTQQNPTAKVEIVEKLVEPSPPPEKPESPQPRFTQLYQDTVEQKHSMVKRIEDAQEVVDQWKNQSKSKLEKAFTQRMGTNLVRHRPCPERLYFASVNPTNDAYLIPISSEESKVAV